VDTDLSTEESSLVKPLKRRAVFWKTPQMTLHDEEEMYFKRMAFDVR